MIYLFTYGWWIVIVGDTWWLTPMHSWVIFPVISRPSRVSPVTGVVITHLLPGMSHEVPTPSLSDMLRVSKIQHTWLCLSLHRCWIWINLFVLSRNPWVTLWSTNIAVEHGHRNSWFTMTGWWFVTWILWLSISWECHNPNWLIFFRGVGDGSTTNQMIYWFSQPVLFILPGASRCLQVQHPTFPRPPRNPIACDVKHPVSNENSCTKEPKKKHKKTS